MPAEGLPTELTRDRGSGSDFDGFDEELCGFGFSVNIFRSDCRNAPWTHLAGRRGVVLPRRDGHTFYYRQLPRATRATLYSH